MLTSSLVLAALFYSTALAQDNRAPDPNNQFIYPPLPGPQASNDPTVFYTNLNFTVGAAISTPWKWTTNMTNMMITLNQEGNPDVVQSRLILDCPITVDYLYWDGDISPIDIKDGNIAFLSAWNCSEPDATPIFFSHYINLTEPAVVSSSSSSAQTSATGSLASAQSTLATNTAVTTVTATSTPTSSSSSTSNNNGGGGSSNAAAIGGGVGGGIGGALILIALAGFFLYWRRNKKKQQKQQNTPNMQHGGETGYPPQGYTDARSPAEMSSNSNLAAQHSYYNKPHAQYPVVELGNNTTSGTYRPGQKYEMSDTSHSQSGRGSHFGGS